MAALRLRSGQAFGGLLNLNQGGQDYAYLYDGKGNVEAVLDAAQSVVAGYRYDPFGALLNQTGSLTQPYGFSTKRYDSDTGLINYGFRLYGPSIARWTTRDSLGESGGMNLYAFVGNNPVNWVDPWGLIAACDHKYASNSPAWQACYNELAPIAVLSGVEIALNEPGIKNVAPSTGTDLKACLPNGAFENIQNTPGVTLDEIHTISADKSYDILCLSFPFSRGKTQKNSTRIFRMQVSFMCLVSQR